MTRTLFQSTEQANGQLQVEMRYPPAIFYALVHNKVPIISAVRIGNLTDEHSGPLTVTVELVGPQGNLTDDWTRQLPSLAPGDDTWLDDFRDLQPDIAALRSADEAFPVSYRLHVRTNEGLAVSVTAPSRVLAHNEWLSAPSLYESIAAFVQPNASSVSQVLRAAGRLLERDTGSSSLQGYQAEPKRVAHIGAAIYEALREEGITYVALPASFEDTGQKIRTTSDVLRDRVGNCIDLAVTYAACLEAAGLHPLIWVIEGHAFAGFFLHDDRLPESVSREPNHLINIVESGKAVPVELTGVGPGADSLSFDRAVQAGIAHLRSGEQLLGMVDVHLAHKSGIRSMPTGSVGDQVIAEVQPRPQSSRVTDLPAELLKSGIFDEEENLEVQVAEDHAPARIHAWRKALLDLSLRNPLLKLPKTGKGLDLHVPVGALHHLDDLIHDGKAIRVVAQDAVSGVQRLQGIQRAQDLDPDVLTDELRSDRRVYGAIIEQGYVAKMRGLQRDARTLEQETGSNYLYLTLGTLVHDTPSGDARAPLFLLPVRIEGGTGHKPYTVQIDGDELAAPNWCLIQWLRVKHGVRIPELDDPITDESGIDIDRSFKAIKKRLDDNQLNYRIDESASLRLLQFSTFQMWRDLTQHWGTFLTNPVVKHLVENPGDLFSDPVATESEPAISEADLHLPIPADGSQMRAISMAEQGRSFVLEGPPGTGKSQTITNLIAHAISSGKTVLFVAEKQAALEVVKRRLNQVGLENFCLDLHGRKQTLRSIRQQLKDANEHHASADDHGWKALEAQYRAQMSVLQSYPDQVHRENSAGYSVWSAYHAVLATGEGRAAYIPASYFAAEDDTRSLVERAANALPAAARSAHLRAHHPWSLCGRRTVAGLEPETVIRAAEQLEDARQAFHRLPASLRSTIAELPRPTELNTAFACAQLASWGRLPREDQTAAARQPGWDTASDGARACLAQFRLRHPVALASFHPDLFVHPRFDDYVALRVAAGKGLFGKKKRREALAAQLRPFLINDARLDERTVLQALDSVSAARQDAAIASQQITQVPGLEMPSDWLPTRPDAAELLDRTIQDALTSRELNTRIPSLWREFSALGTALSLADLTKFSMAWTQWDQLLEVSEADFTRWRRDEPWTAAWDRDGATWANDLRSYGLLPLQRWGTVLSHTDVLAKAGLDAFREQVLTGQLGEEIEVAFLRGVARSALTERLRSEDLEFFDGGAHDRHVENYLNLGETMRKQLPARLAAAVVGRRPIGYTAKRSDAGELIRRLNSRRDRLSFREAVKEYPGTITALTPCFMMSPASVANFLEPGVLTFDMVVFDEASQIRVAQAVGAMGRAKSVVVVGDSKQMPPTSVMQASHGDGDTEEDKAVVEDLDSILTESVESGLPQEWLSWHYRSTDESLIAFSNDRYYDGKLASLPAPGADPTTGISWRRVDGVFDRGTRASRTNKVEADAIVGEIVKLLHDPKTAQRSIGVVTFNVQQRDLLLNLLEENPDEAIQDALTRPDGETLFVKNLENVQGYERDVILFSLAFSKNPETGVLPLNFGPLSVTGGERRLNVAITRARQQVVLFSSFNPSDIDLTRTTATGTKHLRAYLEMAAQGVERGKRVTRRDQQPDQVLADVAAALRERGYEVELHYGLSHFTVDLALRGPGADH